MSIDEALLRGIKPVECVPDDGDFTGDDGLLVCGKCGTAKQLRLTLNGESRIFGCLCKCGQEAEERLQARMREAERLRLIESAPSHRLALKVDPSHEFGLGRDVKRGFRIVRDYALRWRQMAEGGHGLVLIGPPGTGKTFAADCLANYLRHDGHAVLVTNVSRAENVLWDSKGMESMRVLEGLSHYDLIVIDDLGAERDTSYMDSKAFDLVDACYRTGKPLVVTTNVPLSQLKDPKGLSRTRIYDRVLERCQPVIFDGPSFRAMAAEENRAAMRRILQGEPDDCDDKEGR